MNKVETNLHEENLESEISRLKALNKKLASELHALKERDKNLSDDLYELSKKEERLRLLISEVQDYAIFMLDPNGYIISWNSGAERIKGYTAQEVIGKHVSIFYPKSSNVKTKSTYELNIAIQDGKYKEDGWRVRKDGSLFWASVVLTPIYDESRTLLGFSKITRDLTERRNAEEALKESEERYRLLVSGVRDYAIFMLDINGRIASWNEGAKRIKGYEAEEIIGKHFSTFYTKEDLDAKKPENELKIATATGKYEEEGWRVKKDGTVFWANVLISAVRNDRNELIGFSKVTKDLTEKKRADEILREKNKQLELSNSELEQFAYIASHDLQEPLRTVASYVQLLERDYEDKLDETGKEYIKFAFEGAHRMRDLIYALLEYSRVGRTSQDYTEVDTNKIVEIITREIHQTKPEVKIIVTGELPHVNAIQIYMHQLFQNLISNAVKFKKPGIAPIVEISGNRQGKYWCFSVKDNGIGMKPEFIGRIFNIFQRLHTRNEYPGSGIGLSICKKIVELHGGKISVESAPDEGSTFYFTIPA